MYSMCVICVYSAFGNFHVFSGVFMYFLYSVLYRVSLKKLPPFKMKELWKYGVKKLSIGVFEMLKCIVTFTYDKYLKLSWLVRTAVTEVNDTKSREKFLYVAFSLFFIGIFLPFGT